MDIQKEREAFEKLPEIKKRLDMKCVHFNGTWYATNPHMGNSFATASYLNGAWMAWQQAKAWVVPEGFVLMPIKPTETMVMAVVKEHEGDAFLPYSLYDAYVKQAMIEAQEPAND